MSEQNLLLLTNADPRRDSYGFAVRPQHLQRYREYGSIYKEEEEERSDKWTSFLQRCSESIQACRPAEEPLKPLEANATTESSEAVSVNHIEEDGSSGESSTYTSCKEGGVEKEVPSVKGTKHHNVQTWAPLRPSVAPIETMLCVRVKNKVCKTKCHVHPVQEHLPPIVEEMFASENLEELENNSERKRSSEGSPFTMDVSDVQGEETEVPATPASICHYDATLNQTYQENKTSVDVTDKTVENTDDNGVAEKTVENTDDNVVIDKTVENTDDNVVTDKTVENTDDNVVTDKTVENTDDNVVDTESLFPQKEELESLVYGGVPKSLRGEVWQAFVGVRARRVEGYYQELLNVGEDSSDSKHLSSVGSNGSSVCAPEKWRKQIEKDLPRTFPGHPALDEEGRNSLRRILTAYARHNPSVGYCQAMNFFAGLLLLLMPEENAFWMLVGIIDDYFEGYYTHEMIESQVDQLVFEELMRERFPKLVHHLDYLGMEVAWVSGPWFLSIFMNMLPWESVLRVWDVILYEGNRVMLFRTALALMELYGPALVTTHDAADAISLLQSLTGSTFDSSQLVFTACMGFLGVTEARLEELREKHRPSVLGIIEERTKGSEVSKESKSLASKLYSFKQDAQSLIKEPDTNDSLSEKFIDSVTAEANSSPANFDEFMCALSSDTEISSSQDQQEQVVWLKVELCRLMEEKRLATLRAEELETAFLEIVKQDNRRELSARVEELEQEVSLLRQALADKQEQEHAMLQVLMRVEQEQKVTEDARIAAEQEVAAQKHTVHVLQEKYDNAVGSLAEMDKRVVMAESMLQATLQYESGQAKDHSSPRSTRADSPRGRRTGLLSFGLGWRDKNKDQGES